MDIPANSTIDAELVTRLDPTERINPEQGYTWK
jgi:hypothetical protein